MMVFLTLIAMQTAYVIGDFRERAQIRATQAELAKTLSAAQQINQTTEALGKELIELADAKSAEAAKIVAEMNIKVNAPPEK